MKLNTKKLDQVAYGRVVLAQGTYVARLHGVVEENKSKTGHNYVLEHTILNPELVQSDGKMVQNPGMVSVTKWVGLQANEKQTYDPNRLIKELAVAAGVYSDDSDVNTEDLEGKIVLVKLKVKKAEGTFPEGNDVTGWLPLDAAGQQIADSSQF